MTVVETVQFLRDADGLMSDPDRAHLVEFVGANPEAGDAGGARVIYFFHDERLPVFLLTMYGKSADASAVGRNRKAS